MNTRLLLGLCLLLCINCAAQKDQLLFSSNRNGNSDIFILQGKNKQAQQLTYGPQEEWGPSWINANVISFLREDHGNIKRIQLNLETQQEIEIPQPFNCTLDDKNALFSPINQSQLFSCQKDIFFTSNARGPIINLTQDIPGTSAYPSWSHDYKGVVVTSNSNGNNNIYLIDIESKQITPLVKGPSNDERGTISPNGKFLAYSSDQFEKGNQDILLKDLETGTTVNISNSPGTELIARWSGNGKAIYYGSDKNGNWDILKYDLKTEKITPITSNPAFDGDPRIWRPVE